MAQSKKRSLTKRHHQSDRLPQRLSDALTQPFGQGWVHGVKLNVATPKPEALKHPLTRIYIRAKIVGLLGVPCLHVGTCWGMRDAAP